MKQVEQIKYTAEAIANYGREGDVHTTDGALKHPLVKPVGMGGKPGQDGVNPEQLFAAGYAACFHAALLHHARRTGADATESSVRARVSIGTVETGGFGLGVEIIASLPGVDSETATSLLELAHEACPYSRATRGNIEGTLTVLSSHLAPLPSGVPEFKWKRASGSVVWSADGQELIDFTSGVLIANLGHSHPGVTAAIARQAGELVTTFVGHHELRERYARQLVKAIASTGPLQKHRPELDMVAYASSGAEAVDLAVRVARAATGRTRVITFTGSYHGKTTETVSLGGMPGLRQATAGLSGNTIHVPYPDGRRLRPDDLDSRFELIREIAGAVAPDDVAAILAEPYLGAGGAIVPPAGFLDRCRAMADEFGAKLIVDEVQSGFGRTGPLFAFAEMESGPDLAVLAKGIANGFPMAAVVGVSHDMTRAAPGTLWSSYSGNPLACAAAEATLIALEAEIDPVNTIEIGERIRSEVSAWQFGHVRDVRGAGMSLGFDVVDGSGAADAQGAATIVTTAADHGLVLLPPAGSRGNAVRIAPPLNISGAELDRGLESLRRTLASLR